VVCAGPKNYSYGTVNFMIGASKRVRKVKGITLNYNASQFVNFAKMKDMILSVVSDETVIVFTPNKIKRKRGRGGVIIISHLRKRPSGYLS
jgi:hypothetical protein